MKTANIFLKIEERLNGEIFCNNVPIETKGRSKFELNNKIFNINEILRKVFNNTNNTLSRNLKDDDIIEFKRTLEKTSWKNYKPKPGEANSSRFK